MSGNNAWQKPKKFLGSRVKCSRFGCTGSCPLAVILRGSKPDGIPAKCFQCDKVYVVPKNVDVQARATGTNKEIIDLKEQVRVLNKALQARATREEPEQQQNTAMEVDNASKELHDKVSLLQKELASIKRTPEELHYLFESRGGHEGAIQECIQRLEVARQGLRESKPIEQRRAAAEGHLKKTRKEVDQSNACLAELQKTRDEVEARIAKQQAVCADKLKASEAAAKQCAELAGGLAAAPPAAAPILQLDLPVIDGPEVACIQELLQFVDVSRVEEVCKSHAIDPKVVNDRTSGFMAKVKIISQLSQTAGADAPSGKAETDISFDEVLKFCGGHIQGLDDKAMQDLKNKVVEQHANKRIKTTA
jgi:hypothetical protein